MLRAQLAVAPLRISRGIQNKVLEAMAMGLPVVGTTNATQGVEGEHGRDFLVADTAADLIETCDRMLGDPAACAELGARARAFVDESYDWEKVLEPLGRLVRDLTA